MSWMGTIQPQNEKDYSSGRHVGGVYRGKEGKKSRCLWNSFSCPYSEEFGIKETHEEVLNIIMTFAFL